MCEPWLQGTLTDVPAVPRAVLHALELARQDLQRWCGDLSEEELNAQPHGLPSVGFQIRHIAGSMDRLLTYAEGKSLSDSQMDALKTELKERSTPAVLFAQLEFAIGDAMRRIRALDADRFEEPRSVGRNALPTTLGGLLVHVADHTQRHVGQAVTTAKVLR